MSAPRPAANDKIPVPRPPQVGFIGLGNMGFLMARNLARHAPLYAEGAVIPPLLIWNRSPEKSEKLLEAAGSSKIRIARDPEQVAMECDIVISNLANDDVVRAVYMRISAALKESPPTRSKIFVETSTIYPSLAREIDALLTSAPHTHLVTCPILGTPIVAEKAQLILLMSGDYRAKKELVHLVIPAVGRKVVDLGGDLEKAPTFKLIANSLILGNLEVLAEGFTMAEKAGIGSATVHELVKDFFPAPSILNYAGRMAEEQFDGSSGFDIEGGIKDATHMRRLMGKHNCPMPMIDLAYQHLLTARSLHARQATVEKLDWSALIAGTRTAAGLDGFFTDRMQAGEND